jgi:hypothetical protein
MPECPNCGAALEAGKVSCPKCGAELNAIAVLPDPGVIRPDADTRKFVVAGTSEDAFTTEELVAMLEREKIPVMARARRKGIVEPLTSGSLRGWWEILVPEDQAERAAKLIETERARLEAMAEENAKAAEEEEAEMEKAAKGEG